MKGGRGGVRGTTEEEGEERRGEMDRPADGQKPALRRPDRSAFIKAVVVVGQDGRPGGDPRRQ